MKKIKITLSISGKVYRKYHCSCYVWELANEEDLVDAFDEWLDKSVLGYTSDHESPNEDNKKRIIITLSVNNRDVYWSHIDVEELADEEDLVDALGVWVTDLINCGEVL